MKITDLDTKDVQVTRTTKRYILNDKVFELDECPDWAQWAAVNEDGRAHWFDSQPCIRAKCWVLQPCSSSSRICFGWFFDATDCSTALSSDLRRYARLPWRTLRSSWVAKSRS